VKITNVLPVTLLAEVIQ